MTTTPEEPRPDEAVEPAVERAVAPAETASAQVAPPAFGDTQPVTVQDTAPLPPAAPVAPLPPATSAGYPQSGYAPPYGSSYASQPYVAPLPPAAPPQPPVAPAAPVSPYAGTAYPAAYAAPAAYSAQPYYGAQPPAAGPYATYPPQQPYQAPASFAAAGTAPDVAPAGTPPAAGASAPADGQPAHHKKRTWVFPVVAVLVIVVLLVTAAVVISTHKWTHDNTAGASTQPTSIASIGQGSSNSAPITGSTAASPNWTAVASAVQASVVSVDVQTSSGEALGSGVVVDAKGHIVTNNHVVTGLTGGAAQVTLSDGRIYQATVVGTDASTDLAVMALQKPPSDLTVAKFGNSDNVKVGDPVMAVGNPLGLSNTVTTGIVSALNRPVSPQTTDGSQAPVTNAIQIDAAVNPGNSGGPLFNGDGQVIGITSSIATTSSDSGSIGLGFAIPVNLVQNIAQQIIATGSAQHAYLGVTLQDGQATADGVTRLGAQVMSVVSGSPAASAGLRVGDVVVAINGQAVGGADSLAAYVRAMSSGDKVSLVLVRAGKSLTVQATLAASTDATTGGSTGQGSQNNNGNGQGSQNNNGNGQGSQNNGNSGSGLPDNLQNMTPDQLWQWLQQQQQGQNGQSGNGQSGSGQG